MNNLTEKIATHYWSEKTRQAPIVNTRGIDNNMTDSHSVPNKDVAYFLKLAAGSEVAEFTILSTIYGILLQRYFQSGLFIYSKGGGDIFSEGFLLRLNSIETKTVKECLQENKKEVQEVYKYAEAVKDSTMLQYSNYGLAYNQIDHCALSSTPVFFDVTKEKATLDMRLHFSEEIMNQELAKSFISNYQNWIVNLEEILDQPAAKVSILSEEEKERVLYTFNSTARLYPEGQHIISMFEDQVHFAPQKIALVFKETELTYLELFQRVNRFAHFLREKYNVTQGDFIGVKVERNEMLVVALLGVLKAGATYVPIDKNYPAKRVAYIENDCQCKVVLNDQIISIFQFEEKQYSAVFDGSEIRIDDIAYVIYTSGTTGNPKGIMIEHSNAAAMIQWAKSEFNEANFDILYAVTSQCFDLSVFELFYPLTVGKKIRLLHNALEIPGYLSEDHRILINTVPSSMQTIVEGEYDLSNVSMVNLAGEAFPVNLAEKLLKHDLEVRNLYGPSEDTTYSTCYRLSANEAYTSIPIGKPISNTQAYILDEQLQPVPAGVAGKLHIAGTGVAKGYLNREKLTAECFIPNPFTNNGRMYDTGDIAKWLFNGNIAFMGRKDHQVKFHGYRIELSEIETAILKADKNIKQAVVAIKPIEGRDVLAAYLVADLEINTNDLENTLLQSIPAYMVPSHFMQIDIIPLTPNGKTDLKALIEPGAIKVKRASYVAPTTPLEKALTEIWQEVLNIEQVSVHDNFFKLGGHSLMAGQVVNKIYRKLNRSLTIKDFFQEPTIAYLASKLQKTTYTPIPATEPANAYPLTTAQHRIWVLSQLEGGNLAYNMPATLILKGQMDIVNLEKAFLYVIARHEILRTYFKVDAQGQLKQYIVDESKVSFSLVLEDAISKSEEEINANINIFTATPFNLEKTPLLRAKLLKLDENRHLCMITMHHIISDGWSIEIFVSEITAVYNGMLQNESPNLLPLTIQYKDYAVWSHHQLQQESTKEAEAYWLSTFHNEIPKLDLPTFKIRPQVQTYNGKTLVHTFSTGFLERVRSFARESDSTLFMVLMAGINALLHRYTNEEDIIVGTPIAGREHPDLENQFGLYLNTLAIRTAVNGKESFNALLQYQKKVLLSAYEYQTYPFNELINKLNLKRDTSRSPLFDVMVVLQNQSQLHGIHSREELSGISVEKYERERTTSQFDISFTFTEYEKLELEIEYNIDIYDRLLIERIFVHFENLLNGLIKEPTKPLQTIAYVSATEQEQVITLFNGQTEPYSTEATVTDIFEARVAENPEGTAVIFEDRVLSYSQLNRRANQLAHYLKDRYDIKPNDLIAIQLDRSEQLLVTIFGILKAGAGYVPIDITYPKERITYMQADTSCGLTINQQELEHFEDVKKQYSTDNPEKSAQAEDLIYVIYTSGTTGKPKGVMVTHQNVVSIYTSWKQEYKLDTFKINLLQLSSVSFDVFVGDICRSLLNGGKMVIAPDDIKVNPEQLYSVMLHNNISLFEGTPSLLLPLIRYIIDNKKDHSFLKLIIFGSDSFNNQEYNAVKNYFAKSTRVINSYGVTEATIDSTYYEDILTWHQGSTPIGKPFPNTNIYILDAEKQPVPVGVKGEIYIGGAGVSKGYFQRPELNAQRFVSSPFSTATLYYTGDIGRWLPNGNIEFFGRSDHQVKIRGYRIELGEIENTIAEYSKELTKVLVLIRDLNGEKVLAAYYTAADTIDKTELRQFLQSKLPTYMVPDFYMQPKIFPLTPNGKIDRNALPDLSGKDTARKQYVPLEDETEATLAGIWEIVLGVEGIGATDNFFELGGHSLKITQLRNLVNQAFGINASFNNLFLKATIREQAELVVGYAPKESESIRAIALQEDYAVSSAQRRIWVLSQFEGGNSAFNMPGVFKMQGSISSETLQQTFDAVIQRHEALRTVFIQDPRGEIRQKVVSSDEIGFSLLYDDGTFDSLLAIDETIRKEVSYTFSLSKGPLVRARLIRTSADTAYLIFVMHHIISDGWSVEVLITELFASYLALVKGQEWTPTPLSIQYKDYAAWEQSQILSEGADIDRTYWLQQFSDEAPVIDLPTFQKRPIQKTFFGKSIKRCIDKQLQGKFKALCQTHNSTLYMGLLAAIYTLLYRYTDHTDIVIGSPIAGRNYANLQNQIGIYINMLAMRTRFNGQDTFAELLAKTRTTALKAYAHQGYPFDKLVEDLNLRRDMGRHPMFDIMVTLQNTGNVLREISRTEELVVEEYYYSDEAVAKYDLEFNFEETDQGLQTIIVYNSQLYDKIFIDKLFAHLINILEACVVSPEIFLSSLPFLMSWEKEELLHYTGYIANAYAEDQSFLHLFREQAVNNPEATALEDGTTSITYAQLDDLTNKIGSYIKNNYNGNSLPVGILMERSASMVAVLMGVMKVGYAYLPFRSYLSHRAS